MKKHNPKIATLLLAAGAATRMGESKQLLPWKNTTLLGNAIDIALASRTSSVTVVLGANASQIIKEVQAKKVSFVENPNWEQGMGSSIIRGMHSILSDTQTYDAVLIMLGDQPLLDASYLNSLITSYSLKQDKIITTAYGNKSGVPAIFDKSYFSLLSELNTHFGAKDIIKAHKNDVIALDPEGKAVDVDTKETYHRLLNSLKE